MDAAHWDAALPTTTIVRTSVVMASRTPTKHVTATAPRVVMTTTPAPQTVSPGPPKTARLSASTHHAQRVQTMMVAVLRDVMRRMTTTAQTPVATGFAISTKPAMATAPQAAMITMPARGMSSQEVRQHAVRPAQTRPLPLA